MGRHKPSFDTVVEDFDRAGYTVLSDRYINNTSKLNYKCPEGHIHSVSWNSWKGGTRCGVCFGAHKKEYNDVKVLFEKEGYTLVSKDYTNAWTKLIYICPNQHEHRANLHSWMAGKRCPFCSRNAKKSLEDVEHILHKSNYVLLSTEYKNAFSPIVFECDRGHIGTTTWHRLDTIGAKCNECRKTNLLGHGNPNWKGGISCEPYCQDWTKEYKEDIKMRDGNKCLNPYCNTFKNKLVIHHIDYNKKNCHLSNLITVCNSCNSKANTDREWHEAWYSAIIKNRYYNIEATCYGA